MNVHKAKDAVEKKADHAESIFDEATDRFSGLIDDVREKRDELIESVKDRSVQLLDGAQGKGEDAWKDLKIWVRKNPGPALGWSLLAGAVLHAMLTRKED